VRTHRGRVGGREREREKEGGGERESIYSSRRGERKEIIYIIIVTKYTTAYTILVQHDTLRHNAMQKSPPKSCNISH